MALLTFSELKTYCRSFSDHVEQAAAETFILEAEQIDIKPLIGDQLYIDLTDGTTGTSLTDDETMLLDGGNYTVLEQSYQFSGLKKAIAYFTNSRMIRNSTGYLTRYAFVQKETDVSSNVELRQRLLAADEAAKAGNTYLNECLQFIALKEMTATYTCNDQKKRTYTINAIGD